jgi:threonine dehydrogenase-like Zn-dependent dehydrogenase
MRAAVHTGKKTIEIIDKPMPKPGPGEYLVRIKACAICGSDLWWGNDASKDEPVHGHESAGEIVEAGPGAKKFAAGQRVVCYAIKGCGKCDYCKKGVPTHCASKGFIEGGFQEFSVFPESMLFPCPEEYDFITATLLSDAIGVPLRGLRRAGCEKTDSVSVWGLGPLGILQVMFLRAMGVKTIIGADALDERLKIAESFGASHTVNPAKTDAVKKIMELTGGMGTDRAFVYVRLPKVTETVFNSTKGAGTICTFVGLEGNYTLQEWFERTLVWSFYFNPPEYEQNLEFLKKHRIDLKKVISDVYPLEQINAAFQKRFDKQAESMKIVVTL